MARAPYGFEVVREGTRLRALRTGLEDPRFVLTGIGALLESASQRAFTEERMGSVRWKTREETGMVPNWPGIIADFSRGASSPKAHRFHAKHTLTDTGRLRGSIRSRVVGSDTVEVGSNLPYAKALHAGNPTTTEVVTRALQARMWKWMRRLRKRAATGAQAKRLARAKAKGGESYGRLAAKLPVEKKQAELSKRLGWLLNPKFRGKRLTVEHPARPLVGVPPRIAREIATAYGQRVRTA